MSQESEIAALRTRISTLESRLEKNIQRNKDVYLELICILNITLQAALELNKKVEENSHMI